MKLGSFLLVREDQVSVPFGAGDGAGYCAATCCHMPSCPGMQVIVHCLGTEVVPLLVSSEGARFSGANCQNHRQRRCYRQLQCVYHCSHKGGRGYIPGEFQGVGLVYAVPFGAT